MQGPADSYLRTRGALEQYFDRTAAEAWARLTSDAPVSRIRATVRAGRDRMRAALLARLPEDLAGRRVLDAGCGVGQLSAALAERGADVVGVDISPKLLGIARARTPGALLYRIEFRAADMLDAGLGQFDHVVAMDSLIHYAAPDIVGALARLAGRTQTSILFTVAPRTPLLTAMHCVGKLFPRGDRSPAIRPVRPATIARLVARAPALRGWEAVAAERVAGGFYISQAMEVRRA